MLNISMFDAELLKFAIENGMLDTALVQEKIEMQRRRDNLEKHPYKIWQGKDGKWYSYLPDEKCGRKKVKRISKESLEDSIVEFWREKEENPTVREIFTEWIEDKLRYEEIARGTYDRYLEYFDKYFVPIQDKHIKSINEELLEDFVKATICEFDMTAKCFSNFRTLVYGIFKRAKKRKFVQFSITETMKDMEISKRSFKKVVHKAEEQIYFADEKRAVETYLESNKDIINLGLLLMFKTGLRVGELAALKHRDVQNYTVFISRTETSYKGADGKRKYEVKEFPKTEAGVRYAVLPEKYKWIMDEILKLNPAGEFLLEKKNGNRVRTYEFRRRLKTVCENKVNIKSKSPHKIRKTYGTILLDSNVRESTIVDAMGHTDIGMTKGHYYYDRTSIEDKRKELEMVADL